MLKFKLTDDHRFISLVDFELNSERNDLFNFFKRKSKKGEFNALVDRGIWDGKDKFITKEGRISIGLWKEVYNFASRFGYDCEIDGVEAILNLTLPKDKYLEYVNRLLEGVVDEFGNPIKPRDYQIEGAYRAIKYKFCTQELATSAGKTLIFYIFNSFLRDGKKIDSTHKSLIIVPSISLVGQTAEKFELYSVGKKPWKVCSIGGDNKFNQKAFDESEIVVSTYQSLQNWEPKFFESFSTINIDECLHPDSLIFLADHSKIKISEVKPGDIVMTINDTTSKIEYCEVDLVHHNLSKNEQMYEIELENGETLKATGNHKVKLIDNTYKRIDELTSDDEILTIFDLDL